MSAGKLRTESSAKVESATAALADARARVREDTTIRVDLPDTAVPAGKRVLELHQEDTHVLVHGPERLALVGPNGDQLGTFNFRTRGLSLRNNDTREIVADANGDFYIVGECDGQMCVYKFRADGALDTGPCVADVDADGRVSAASDGLAIVRNMLGVPIPVTIPPGLGYDIDGDGVLNASRDGLLILRRMLGFTGTALLRDIPSATTARRTTASDIESYLRMRCGIPRP